MGLAGAQPEDFATHVAPHGSPMCSLLQTLGGSCCVLGSAVDTDVEGSGQTCQHTVRFLVWGWERLKPGRVAVQRRWAQRAGSSRRGAGRGR